MPLDDDDVPGHPPEHQGGRAGGAFLTLAIVMGEFTIANLAAFQTFPIFIQFVNESQGFPAGALTLMSFAITWVAMLSLLAFGRKKGGGAGPIAGMRR